jgi:SecD/SecF fusion protein
MLFQGLKPYLGENVDFATFIADYRQSSSKVGPTVADDIKVQSMWAVVFSLIGIFLYIFLRFRNWQFGFGGVLALMHDSMIIVSVYTLFWGILPFSLEVDQSFIAAILTIIGYSINDTVVVYDRIREDIGLYRKRGKAEVFNMAINSTLSRTINTSLTTIFVLLVIFIFGGETIRGFIMALTIGIAVGTYSSIFVASPLVYDTTKESLQDFAMSVKRKS